MFTRHYILTVIVSCDTYNYASEPQGVWQKLSVLLLLSHFLPLFFFRNSFDVINTKNLLSTHMYMARSRGRTIVSGCIEIENHRKGSQ
jgi:hypothetical protein